MLDHFLSLFGQLSLLRKQGKKSKNLDVHNVSSTISRMQERFEAVPDIELTEAPAWPTTEFTERIVRGMEPYTIVV